MSIGKWVPPAAPTYLMNQGFNAWPKGYTQTYGHLATQFSASAGGASPEARLYYGTAVNNEDLISPSINTEGYTHLHLAWRTFIDYYSSGTYFYVMTRANPTDTWTERQTTFWTNPIGGNIGPIYCEVDVSDDIGYDTQVMFFFQGTPFNFDYWYVDNVQFFVPAAPGYYLTEYDQTVLVDIPVGGFTNVVFPLDWTPAAYQNEENVQYSYQAFATTLLVGDEIPEDDSKTKNFDLFYGYLHDIEVTQIISPTQNGLGQVLPVKATIKNIGQFPECCFQSNVLIGAEVQTQSYFNDFESNSGGYTTISYNSPWGWGVPNTGAHSGAYAWKTNLYGAYLDYANERLSTPLIPIPANSRLAFWLYLDTEGYPPSYCYDGVNVKYSTDGVNYYLLGAFNDPYNTPYCYGSGIYYEPCFSGHLGWIPVVFDISAFAGQSISFRFHFASDGSVTYNGVAVDDVEIYSVGVAPEYDESYCQPVNLEVGQSADITLPNWEPANLELGVNGDISYIVSVESLLAGDSNPSNNIMTAMFTLSWMHDVTVKKITQPSQGGRGGTVIFSQEPYGSSEWLSAYTSSSQVGYVCAEDFWDLTDCITDVEWWGLQGIFAGGWSGGNPTGSIYTLTFYEDNAGNPGAQVAEFTGLEPTITDVGNWGWYSDLFFFQVDLPEAVCLTNGWVKIDNTATPDGSVVLWMDSPTGNMNAQQNGASLGDNLAFNLTAGGGGGGGAPPVTVYVKPGTQPNAAIVSNPGTFPESGLTANAEIKEFITDPDNGTSVWTDTTVGISLNPLGEEKTITFSSFNYANEGIYGLYVELPLADDVATGNNAKALGIGVDNTPPTSTISKSPANPDGNNSWYVSDVTLTVTGTDPESNGVSSGVKQIMYKINSGDWQTKTGATATFKVTTSGVNTILYKAVDNVGNEQAQQTTSVKIDKGKPTISLTYEVTGGNPIQGYDVTFTATCTDDTSLLDKVEFYFNAFYEAEVVGPGPTYQWMYHYTPLPNQEIKAIVYDLAGNSAFDTVVNPVSHDMPQSQPQSMMNKLVQSR